MITIKRDLSAFSLPDNQEYTGDALQIVKSLHMLKAQAEEFGMEAQFCFENLCMVTRNMSQSGCIALLNDDEEEFSLSFSTSQENHNNNAAHVHLIIKYEDITITNELKQSDYLKEAYFCYNLMLKCNPNRNTVRVYMVGSSIFRENVPYRHIATKYIHSHSTTYDYMSPSARNYKWGGFTNTDQLCYGDEEFKMHLIGDYNSYDFDPASVIHFTRLFLSTESLHGVPYKYIVNNWRRRLSVNSMSGANELKEHDCAILADSILRNIENTDLKLDINSTTGTICVYNCDYLIELAKDAKLDMYLKQENNNGSFCLPQVSPDFSIDVRDEYVLYRTKNCQSHFIWSGNHIKLKPYRDFLKLNYLHKLGFSYDSLHLLNKELNKIVNNKLKLYEIYG